MIIASMKTVPPIPTIAIAKAIQGIATTTREVVSDISGTSRCRRERAGGAGSHDLRFRLLEVEQVVGVGQEASLPPLRPLRFLAFPPELERGRVEVLDRHCLAPKRRSRSP